MSALRLIDLWKKRKELPVWIIHGVNWHAVVPLDEYNASFDIETQAYEAASQAIWAFKGNDNGIFLVVDEGEFVPLLSTTMIAHLKGTDPDKGLVPYTHIVLANQGFYDESRRMEVLFQKDLEIVRQKIEAKLAEQRKKNNQLPPNPPVA